MASQTGRKSAHAPRHREDAHRRRLILDAARKLFAREGLEAASVRAIAKHIGTSPATIYHHFGSKDELLEEICLRDFHGLSAAFFLHVAIVKDPVERLRRMGRSYLDFALRHPRQYAYLLMRVQPMASAGTDRGDRSPLEDAYLFLLTTVSEAAAQDRFRPEYQEPDSIAHLLWGALHGLAALHVARPSHDPLDNGGLLCLSEITMDVVFRGLLR